MHFEPNPSMLPVQNLNSPWLLLDSYCFALSFRPSNEPSYDICNAGQEMTAFTTLRRLSYEVEPSV